MQSDLIVTGGHLRHPAGAAVLDRIGRIVDYLFGVLYALLVVRFALEFFGARSGAGFFQLIRELTDVFYAPFKGIFATTTIDTGHFVWPLIVAVLGYMVLHACIRGLLRLIVSG
jgi:YGGT family protein